MMLKLEKSDLISWFLLKPWMLKYVWATWIIQVRKNKKNKTKAWVSFLASSIVRYGPTLAIFLRWWKRFITYAAPFGTNYQNLRICFHLIWENCCSSNVPWWRDCESVPLSSECHQQKEIGFPPWSPVILPSGSIYKLNKWRTKHCTVVHIISRNMITETNQISSARVGKVCSTSRILWSTASNAVKSRGLKTDAFEIPALTLKASTSCFLRLQMLCCFLWLLLAYFLSIFISAVRKYNMDIVGYIHMSTFFMISSVLRERGRPAALHSLDTLHLPKPHERRNAPLSTDHYHKLPRKIAVLETRIHQLGVNVEASGLRANHFTTD